MLSWYPRVVVLERRESLGAWDADALATAVALCAIIDNMMLLYLRVRVGCSSVIAFNEF